MVYDERVIMMESNMRSELKYQIPIHNFTLNQSVLRHVLDEDVHNTATGYLVRSLYFDTLQDDDLADKLQGLHQRRKIRLRTYSPDADQAKLELKEKIGNRQRKQYLLLSRQEATEMIQGNYAVLAERTEPLAAYLYGLMLTKLYRPKCIVEYRRIAYQAPTNQIRMTFDFELKATESNLNLFDPKLATHPIARQDQVIFEVKYQNFLLSYLRDLIHAFDRTETSVSKYCLGRAAITI